MALVIIVTSTTLAFIRHNEKVLEIPRISALYLILNGTKEEHLNMLEGGIIAKLLDEKWSTFAKVSIQVTIAHKAYLSSFQGFFIKRLAILILHLITVSMAVYQRPNIKFSLVRGIKEGTGDITTEDVSRFKLPKE